MGPEIGITYDWDGEEADAPCEGDVLVTTRSRYLVLSVRRVNSRVHSCRWSIRAARMEEDEEATGVRVLPLRWYRRGKT